MKHFAILTLSLITVVYASGSEESFKQMSRYNLEENARNYRELMHKLDISLDTRKSHNGYLKTYELYNFPSSSETVLGKIRSYGSIRKRLQAVMRIGGFIKIAGSGGIDVEKGMQYAIITMLDYADRTVNRKFTLCELAFMTDPGRLKKSMPDKLRNILPDSIDMKLIVRFLDSLKFPYFLLIFI